MTWTYASVAREEVSVAMLRTPSRPVPARRISSSERIAPLEAMAQPGTMRRSSLCAKAVMGTSPRSAVPLARRSAHWAGIMLSMS